MKKLKILIAHNLLFTILILMILNCSSCHNQAENLYLPPGALSFSSALNSKIKEKYLNFKNSQSNYTPRTKHISRTGQAKFTNRLFLETSPYLLQHAHNPVNWHPWGKEAFAQAKKLNRPIFLSIGYSTCHWCHVMEEESFEDVEIAKYLNENYIAIKVDREERPDVDAIYMAAVQAITGGGGWPMSVWLSTARQPFYGATYIPARDGDRGTKTGFLSMLKRLKSFYHNEPEKIKNSTKQLSEIIINNLENSKSRASTVPTKRSLKLALEYYIKNYDPIEGGINRRPKFPSSLPIAFLLRQISKTESKSEKNKILNMVTFSLKKMANGGMYDHIAGGFHRYSTDKKWLIPHFEKMLYDNALLAVAYIETYQVTKNPFFSRVAKEILDYVTRDMTNNDGAFYSATDADSIGPSGHQEEGYFFTWNLDELKECLSVKEIKFVMTHYGVNKQGNFENNRTILNVGHKRKLSVAEVKIRETIKHKLYQERKRRPSPLRDEKILTSWNGLMISAFSKVGFILNNENYIAKAEKAAKFVWEKLQRNNRLFRTYKGSKENGQAKFNGYLDDYAFIIASYLDLYQATSNKVWLQRAIKLDNTLEVFFEDKKLGGYYMTSHDHEKLLAREKPAYDGAEPSGNSIQALNLLRLNKFTTKDHYRKRATELFKFVANILNTSPMALSELLLALDYYLTSAKEILVLLPANIKFEDTDLAPIIRSSFIPHKIISIVNQGSDQKELEKIIPLFKEKIIFDKKATAYICQDGICKLPTTKANILKVQLAL
jgi:uncharacterized protein